MYQVKVANLPIWVSELHLKQYFETCGNVVRASIALSDGAPRPLGHGFVYFDTPEALQNAIDKNGARFDGAVIKVSAVDIEPAQLEKTGEYKASIV